MSEFSNWPVQWKTGRYDEAREQIIKQYGSCKGLIAIYEWGSVSVPGISDLDFMLVFDENAAKMPLLKRSFFALDRKTKEVLVHPVVYVPQSVFADIEYVNPDVHLKRIHGEHVEKSSISAKEKNMARISLLNDLAIRHYPRDFLRNSIDVRNTLLRLNSLRYTIKTLSSLSKKRTRKLDEFSKNVEMLRKNWFNYKDVKQLNTLYKEAFGISIELVEMLSELLKRNEMVTVSSEGNVLFKGIKNKSTFSSLWNQTCAKENKYGSFLPSILCPQLFEYAKGSGPISEHIRNHLDGKIMYKTQLESVIRKRIDFFNAQARLAERLRHSDFPAFFDYGFRTRKGINNRLLSLMDNLRY